MESNENGSERLQRFHAAFERGQQGEVDSFDIWLDDWGYRADVANQEAIAEYFRNHPDSAANHQDALETVGEYIGFATTRKDSYHVAVIGPEGIGKTQLLHAISYYISEIDANIEHVLFNAAKFGDKADNRFILEDCVDEIQSFQQSVVAVDDCHLDKRIDYSLKELQSVTEIGVIITAWTPEGYSFNREKVIDAVDPSAELHLGPLSKSDTFAAIDAIFDVVATDAPGFDIKAKEQIHRLSHAIPNIIITIIVQSLHESFVGKLEPGSEASIEAAGARLNLDDAMKRIYDLSAQKMEILRWILLSLDPRGRSPGELVDKLDRDKSTISYHLRTLSDQGFVTSQPEGRRTYYQVPNHLASLIQLRLAQDQQFHAEL